MKTKKILRLQPKWARIADGNHRALLLCESRVLSQLREAARKATHSVALSLTSTTTREQAKRMALQLALHASAQLVSDVGRGVLAGRRAARAAALERLHVELAAAAKEIGFSPPMRAPMSDAAEDPTLAQSCAESYASAWKAGISLASLKWAESDSEESISRVVLTSSDSIDYRLSRIAATEVSRAYSDEHDEGAGWTAQYYEGERWLGLLVKRWDAMLDRKVCAICKDMDGRFTMLGMRFRGGLEPGEVHCLCRCVDSVIPLPIHMRGELVPGDIVDDEHPRDRAA